MTAALSYVSRGAAALFALHAQLCMSCHTHNCVLRMHVIHTNVIIRIAYACHTHNYVLRMHVIHTIVYCACHTDNCVLRMHVIHTIVYCVCCHVTRTIVYCVCHTIFVSHATLFHVCVVHIPVSLACLHPFHVIARTHCGFDLRRCC